ncbi:uncharacterized protein EV420DRAFT_1570578 [Desarmillaria tabescens]|uniref:Uncharacterized protein n=1 Tax=Armillaria tabescens TaxID=1929756 RepID=A0AA39JPI8_ARMTA|nr:uncharacterized protein EV420DRAFT_1570578 [Desarmillaria tabescens]KAK0446423.1 hypothetical protein EV420DRAFT_1570578 [Desarmillaria tabescens]
MIYAASDSSAALTFFSLELLANFERLHTSWLVWTFTKFLKMFYCDPKAYVWSLFLASHVALVVSAAPARDYTKRLAGGSSTVKIERALAANNGDSTPVSGLPGLLPALATPSSTVSSSTSGNSEVSSLLKEVTELAPGTTVINVNVGDKNLGSLLSDTTSGATNPSDGPPESGVATGGFGDTASGNDGDIPLDGTGGVGGFDDDTTIPSAPTAVGDGSLASTSSLDPGTTDDGGDGDTNSTNSDSLVGSAIQDDAMSWKGVNGSDPAMSSDNLDPGSGAANGTVVVTTGSNSTAGVGDSHSNTSDGASPTAGGPPTNGTSILKISIENNQKINIEKGVLAS